MSKQNTLPANYDRYGTRRPGQFGARGAAMRFAPVSRPKDLKAVIGRLWQYLKMQRKPLLLVFASCLVSSSVAIFAPRLVGMAIDPYIIGGDFQGLRTLLAGLLAMYALNSAASWTQQVNVTIMSNGTLRQLRHDLFSVAQSLPLSYFDETSHGDLMSRLTNDVDTVGMALGQPIAQLFTSAINIVGIMVMMFTLNVWMTLVVLTMAPVTLFVTVKVAIWSRRYFKQRQEALGELNSYVEEMVSGARVVKVFGREAEVCESFDIRSQHLKDIAYRAELISGMFMPAMHLLENLGFAVVALIGSLLAARDIVTIGTVASFIMYSRQFMLPVRDISNQWNTVQSGLAGAERVFEVMSARPETDAPGARDLPVPVSGHVVFEDVSFAYTPGTPVLTDISLEARPGQTIALVGATGSGKTTIISILSRFYDIESGHVYIDGIDIQSLRRESVRKALGIVLQQSHLFSGTVRENIRYGRLDATDAEVERAAELAHADAFIRRMPLGYESELTADGGNLSQGQRQLLCIARAILADPAILILDEATSSVDTVTELHIQEAMLRLMQGRTCVVIAHRLSTIQGADKIIVIDQGRIVERGSHGELLERNGAYSGLYKSQFEHEGLAAEG